jgi:hypothetical protein
MNEARTATGSSLVWLTLFFAYIISRVLWNLLYPMEISGDCRVYFKLAESLRFDGAFAIDDKPNVYWPPLWPATLSQTDLYSLFWGVSGPLWITWAAGGLALLVLVKLALELADDDPRPAQVMAILYTFSPGHLLMSNIPSTEHLFQLFLGLALLGVGRVFRLLTGSGRSCGGLELLAPILCFGASLGGATMTRPITLPLYPLLAGAVVVLAIRMQFRLAAFALLALIVAGLPVAMWTRRNLELTDTLIIVSANGTDNLWLGANWHVEPYWREPITYEERVINRLPPELAHRELQQRALDYIQRNPIAWTMKGVRKIEHYFGIEPAPLSLRWQWFQEIDKESYNIIRGLNGIVLYSTLVLAVVCMVFWWVIPVGGGLTRLGLWICLAVNLYLMAVAFLTWGMPRYRYPAEPFLWLMAATGAIRAVRARRAFLNGRLTCSPANPHASDSTS